MNILDTELRLVTPTNAEGKLEATLTPTEATTGAADSQGRRKSPSGELSGTARYYQLTHDYLVPALSEWLTRKQRETRRGRAVLLLHERTSWWVRSRSNRLLPSLGECLRIAAFTRPQDRAANDRHMLRRACLVHSTRLTAVAALVCALALTITAALHKPRSKMDVFQDRRLPVQKRLEAFAGLPLTDEAEFEEVCRYLKPTGDDPGLYEPVLRRLAERLGRQGGETGARQERLFDLVFNLLMTSILETDREENLGSAALAALTRIGTADQVRDMVKSKASEVQRNQFINIMALVAKTGDPKVRPQAFRLYTYFVPRSQALDLIVELFQDNPGDDVRAFAGPFFDELDLDQLAKLERQETVRKLLASVSSSQSPEGLVDMCASVLERRGAASLCGWFMEADEGGENYKSPTDSSLYAYTQKRHNPKLLAQVGEHISERLRQQLKPAPEEIVYTYELEYLVLALQYVSVQDRQAERQRLLRLLKQPDRLSSPGILDTILYSYQVLCKGDRLEPAPVRAILQDVGYPVAVRSAAGKLLGDSADADSLALLMRIAADRNDDTSVRVAVVEGLIALGNRLDKDVKAVAAVRDTLRKLLTDAAEERPSVVKAAISGWGDLAAAAEASILFTYFNQAEYNNAAVVAVKTIMVRKPLECSAVVKDYLGWRKKAGPLDKNLLSPDEILGAVDYQSVKDPSHGAMLMVAKKVAETLVEEFLDSDPTTRKVAEQILADKVLDKDIGAPRIDPEAAAAERTRQVAQWKRWWDRTHPRLRLTKLGLTLP